MNQSVVSARSKDFAHLLLRDAVSISSDFISLIDDFDTFEEIDAKIVLEELFCTMNKFDQSYYVNVCECEKKFINMNEIIHLIMRLNKITVSLFYQFPPGLCEFLLCSWPNDDLHCEARKRFAKQIWNVHPLQHCLAIAGCHKWFTCQIFEMITTPTLFINLHQQSSYEIDRKVPNEKSIKYNQSVLIFCTNNYTLFNDGNVVRFSS